MGNEVWAKLEHVEPLTVGRKWLSLVDHSADVAAVFEAMLRVPLVAGRLARLASVDRFPDLWISRLAVHVALHDFGKANRGFQARRDPNAPLIGHVGPGLALIYTQSESILQQRLCETLPFEEIGSWGAADIGLRTVAAHHGRPIAQAMIEGIASNAVRQLWAQGSDYDPIAALAPLGVAVRTWFPLAFEPGGPPLPEAPQFWHAVAGLVMLADWIGSDARAFPLEQMDDRMIWARHEAPQALIAYGFDPAPKRAGLSKTPVTFGSISSFPPRGIQLAAGEADGQIVIVEAETGSGKTEAALWRFARLFETGEVDGLYFALPTRVAAKSLYDRVCAAVERMFPADQKPSVILAVPGYARVDGISGRQMPGFEVLWDDDKDGGANRVRWAAEHPKRFLAGTIAVGTIDQALLGAIRVKHAHMRSSALLRHLLVVDEVHASDIYMERLLTSLLSQHSRAGGHALLLSATLGSAARQRLLGFEHKRTPGLDEAIGLPYPAISTSRSPTPRCHPGHSRQKSVSIEIDHRIADAEAVAQMALKAAEQYAKVLVVRNLHRSAVATAEALHRLAPDHHALFRCRHIATLHHGRFSPEDRELLDAEIEVQMKADRATRGLVLIGTQTLEQSLDICADLLITDLSPADVLLQRMGRLHRHVVNPRPAGFEQPRCVLLCPPDLAPHLKRADHGLGGDYGPYRDLVVLEATRRLAIDHQVWTIPAMNRLLVEQATHPDALDTLTAKLAAIEPRWQASRQNIEGAGLADAYIAAQAKLPWSESFTSDAVAFPGHGASADDARYGTRLGAQDLVVVMPDATIGPFGTPIRTLAIPNFWLGGIDLTADVTPQAVGWQGVELHFSIQTRCFSYGSLGLRVVRANNQFG